VAATDSGSVGVDDTRCADGAAGGVSARLKLRDDFRRRVNSGDDFRFNILAGIVCRVGNAADEDDER